MDADADRYQFLARQFLATVFRWQKSQHYRVTDRSLRGEMFVLMSVARHGRVFPNQISGEMDISTARIAAVLNSLENKGLITRQIDKADRRQIIVELTPTGHAMAEANGQKVLDMTVRMLEALGPDDASELVRIWGRLSEVAGDWKAG